MALDFSSLGHPRRLAYTIWVYAEDDQPGRPPWSGKIVAEPVRDEVLVFPVSPAPMPHDLAPGLYVIEVFTRLRRGGDTQQGFKLLVEPTGGTATPAAGVVATPLAEPACEEGGG